MALRANFVGSNIEKIGPKIAQMIRKEAGTTSPIPYQIEVAAARSTTFSDLLAAGMGGSLDEIHRLVFELPGHRPTALRVSLVKMGLGSVIGSLLYSTEISKKINGEVFIEELGYGSFVGDPAAAEKLNADRELVKQANKFISTDLSLGGNTTVRASGYFGIRPENSKSLVIAKTLLKQKVLGAMFGLGGLSFGIDQFGNIASTIDMTL